MTKESLHDEQKKRRGALLGAGLVLLSAAGYALYRKATIRPEPLPPAVDSERRTFHTPAAGTLSYYVGKQGSGAPLLLLHSINAAGSAYEMKPLFAEYQGSRPVFALELPGFGFSDRSPRAYLPEVYVEAITAFLESQVGAAADVVALSLSSEFAAQAALDRPDLFRSLTLISPTGFRAETPEIPSDALYRIFSFPLLKPVIYGLLTLRPVIRYYLGMNFVGDPPAGLIDYAYRTSHQPGAVNAPLYFVSGYLFTRDIRPAVYARLTVPTLVIYDRDPNVQFDTLPELLTINPHWQATRVAPTLGLPHWEMPAETNRALACFWAS